MVYGTPSSTGAFNSLPIELNKVIAHQLDTNKDIATYRLICRATNDAIDADNGSFWRAKFRERYDLKEGVPNTKLAKQYQDREKHLKRGTGYDFFRGHKHKERDAMRVLRELIVESFQGGDIGCDDYGRPVCKNQLRLKHFVLNSKLLLNDRRALQPTRNEPAWVNPELAALKLMCSHFLFELEGAKHDVFAIEESQRAVYLPTNAAPIYKAPGYTEIHLDWVLHCLNFFRYHMMNEEVASLFDAVEALAVTQKPSAWRESLQDGAYALGKHWKGTYSYLLPKEIRRIRRLLPDQVGDEYFIDKNVEEGKIQSLELDFIQNEEPLSWPALFEERLQSLRKTGQPNVKTQGRKQSNEGVEDPNMKNIQFVGQGKDLEDEFNAIGWLNPLPPQAGIPGWQRITFMKHFMDDLKQVEQDNLWAYEGVVLPGGRIILGRWWFASDPVDFDVDYNGPFILWAVEPEPKLDSSDIEDED